MTITAHIRGDAAVLKLGGPLTSPGVGDHLQRAVDRLVRGGFRFIVADLDDVPAIDASGVGSLVTAYRTCLEHFGRFGLVRVPRRVQHVIDITGLAAIFKAFDSVDAALLNSLGLSAGEGLRWRQPASSSLQAHDVSGM